MVKRLFAMVLSTILMISCINHYVVPQGDVKVGKVEVETGPKLLHHAKLPCLLMVGWPGSGPGELLTMPAMKVLETDKYWIIVNDVNTYVPKVKGVYLRIGDLCPEDVQRQPPKKQNNAVPPGSRELKKRLDI